LVPVVDIAPATVVCLDAGNPFVECSGVLYLGPLGEPQAVTPRMETEIITAANFAYYLAPQIQYLINGSHNMPLVSFMQLWKRFPKVRKTEQSGKPLFEQDLLS
jgi:hypothetical protein